MNPEYFSCKAGSFVNLLFSDFKRCSVSNLLSDRSGGWFLHGNAIS